MQHWVIFNLWVKKHHRISSEDLQKVFSSQACNERGKEGERLKKK